MEQNRNTRNSCYTYFRMSGEFDPDEVTALLGLQPDQSWKSGDLRGDGTAYDFSHWLFGRCDAYSILVEEQMRKTILPLLDKVGELNHIREHHAVSFFLEIVPTLYVGEINPCLAPPLDVIDFCHATRTEIDIDVYLMDAEEE